MKTWIGRILLSICLACSTMALDLPDAPKKAKPVPHPLSHSWDPPGKSNRVLRAGKPIDAGMSGTPLEEIDGVIQSAIEQNLIPGAVVLVARRGVIVKEKAYGLSAKYRDDEFTPKAEPIRMQTDTIFDLASISKLFTSTAVMQLVEQGRLQLDERVAAYLPEFAANGKKQVTVRQLLTHTSGFPAYIPLYKKGNNRAERLQIVLRHPLAGQPGSTYVYSDLNMITLGALVEKQTGMHLDAYIRAHIIQPLGMSRTMFTPPKSLQKQIAATEFQSTPDRGLVWGEVQDENAWALGGAAGHAGLFGTARDLAVFAQMILNGGTYGGKQILSAQSVGWMTQNQLAAFPGEGQGLGWELDRGAYMDALSDSRAMGHTGFTGTALVVSPNQEAIGILLTNRIHPIRDTAPLTPIRGSVMRQIASAIPVDVPWKEGVWYAGAGDMRQALLTTEADLVTGGTLTFDTWHRIENEYDFGYVEVSRDGISWDQIGRPQTGESDWIRVTWELPADTRFVRFRYATDDSINGRGWYIHRPVVTDNKGRQWKTEWLADGWQLEKARKEGS